MDVDVEGLGFLVFLTVGKAVVVVVVVDVVGGSVVVRGVEVVVVVLGVQDGEGVGWMDAIGIFGSMYFKRG